LLKEDTVKMRIAPAWQHSFRWAAPLVLVVAAIGGGVAYASIPGSGNVINGCRDIRTGALSVIDSTAKCPKGTTGLNWNQTGPAGPAGPTGPAGPPGPTGTVSSLDDLEGKPCNTADTAMVGSVHISYDNTNHAVSMSCSPSNPSLAIFVVSSQYTFVGSPTPPVCPPDATQISINTCMQQGQGSLAVSPPAPTQVYNTGTSGTQWYPIGTQISVTATPDAYSHVDWGTGTVCAGTVGDTCTFTISGNTSLTATFVPNTT
jgi:hypothetical protein